jgi:Tfp pilus assembly protein PilV
MNRDRRRRGGMFIECTVALVILGAAVLTAAQMTVAVTGQQRTATQRQLARQEAANLMERLFALSDRQLAEWKPDEGQLALSEAARQWLPGVTAAVTVSSQDDPPSGKRIAVEIRWTNEADRVARPVRLVAWRYPGETQP